MNAKEKKKRSSTGLFPRLMWLDSYYVHPRHCRWLIEEMPLKAKHKVIDIGCGSGWLARDVSRIVTEGEVVGVDISEEFIRKTKEVTRKKESDDGRNIVFKVASAEKIPYPDDYFDCAVSLASFSFWHNPKESLREIRRILKPKGVLIIADIYREGPLSISVGVTIYNFFVRAKMNIYSLQEYETFFESAGFKHVLQKKTKGLLLTAGAK